MRALIARLLAEEAGQDLLEYALLTTLVGLLGAASADFIRSAIAFVYGTWVSTTNNLWESPPPT
jgi:Flp pilus assembly pilin Flp